MKRWHWRFLGIAAAAWLVVALVRNVGRAPGNMSIGGVVIAGAVTMVLTIVSVTIFRYLWLLVSLIWRERWEWFQRILGRPSAPRPPTDRTWHSNVDGIAQQIVLVIFEAGIYWFALISGYGVLLGVYIMCSLAWTGDVALTTMTIG